MWLLLVAPVFLLVLYISIHLNFVNLGRVKSKQDICTPKAGEACCSDLSPSPGEGNSLYLGDSLTTLNVASLGDVVNEYVAYFLPTHKLEFLPGT